MSKDWKPETPYLTTDGIVEIYLEGVMQGIAVITRKNPPYGVALPGGFVDVGESVETALCREMKEEIGVRVEIIKLLGVYSDPSRDPRFHTASVVYVARANTMPIAGDDAKSVTIVSLSELTAAPFVFDHKKIVTDYLNQMRYA